MFDRAGVPHSTEFQMCFAMEKSPFWKPRATLIAHLYNPKSLIKHLYSFKTDWYSSCCSPPTPRSHRGSPEKEELFYCEVSRVFIRWAFQFEGDSLPQPDLLVALQQFARYGSLDVFLGHFLFPNRDFTVHEIKPTGWPRGSSSQSHNINQNTLSFSA